MPQKVAKCCLDLFTIPQNVAMLIKRHKVWHLCEIIMDHKKPIDTRFRLKPELHEILKEKAKREQRSMNYLMNKAVELLLTQENAKA